MVTVQKNNQMQEPYLHICYYEKGSVSGLSFTIVLF